MEKNRREGDQPVSTLASFMFPPTAIHVACEQSLGQAPGFVFSSRSFKEATHIYTHTHIHFQGMCPSAKEDSWKGGVVFCLLGQTHPPHVAVDHSWDRKSRFSKHQGDEKRNHSKQLGYFFPEPTKFLGWRNLFRFHGKTQEFIQSHPLQTRPPPPTSIPPPLPEKQKPVSGP